MHGVFATDLVRKRWHTEPITYSAGAYRDRLRDRLISYEQGPDAQGRPGRLTSVTVQRGVPRVRAEYFRRALRLIGASVEVRSPSGQVIEPPEEPQAGTDGDRDSQRPESQDHEDPLGGVRPGDPAQADKAEQQ